MKILLSAFGFAPGKGSDAEVGWKWATTLLGKGHDVWVVTREDNRKAVQEQLAGDTQYAGLHLIYYDMDWFLRWTRMIKWRHYLYYYLWQWGAYHKVARLHEKIGFDLVHHVTWVSFRQPSFMGGLGIPFFFGPLAGGEAAPWRLRAGYGVRQRAADLFRDFVNFVVRFDPCLRDTFRKAERIYVTSEQTLKCLPKRYREKARVQIAIGIDWTDRDNHTEGIEKEKDAFRVLYVGRFIGWKGMHLGLRAFRKFLEVQPRAHLTMVGCGLEEMEWRNLAQSLGLAGSVEWIPWMERKKLPSCYRSHDVFLKNALCRLAEDDELRRSLSDGARRRVEDFRWEKLVRTVYSDGCLPQNRDAGK